MIQVAAVVPRQLPETVQVVNDHLMGLDRDQAELAQLAKHTIDMNGAEAESIGEDVLVERAREPGGRECSATIWMRRARQSG